MKPVFYRLYYVSTNACIITLSYDLNWIIENERSESLGECLFGSIILFYIILVLLSIYIIFKHFFRDKRLLDKYIDDGIKDFLRMIDCLSREYSIIIEILIQMLLTKR